LVSIDRPPGFGWITGEAARQVRETPRFDQVEGGVR
jgi:hypothetical protein